MNGSDAMQQEAVNLRIREREVQAADDRAAIRAAKERSEEYGRAMAMHSRRIDEASAGEDPRNYFVQRRAGARRELESFLGQTLRDHAETLDEVERDLNSRAEEQLDQLRREKANASWA